ncbi:MAG: SDR family oxidoreductase [Candidatus Zixiibacteriota bacterium]
MKQILVTGASRGIGRAVAVRLSAPGRTIWLHGRDRDALEETCKVVVEAGGKPIVILADLADDEQLSQMIDRLSAQQFDLVVNNAGLAHVENLNDISLEHWQQSFAVNVTAPFRLIQKVTPSMPPGSAVVSILSSAAKTGFPGWSSYCMSKFALEGFTRSVREELRLNGIRVINVYPGATDTDIWNDIAGSWPREKMMPASEVAEAVAYAVERPGDVLIESIDLGGLGGNL